MWNFLRRKERPVPARDFLFVPKLEGLDTRVVPAVVANPNDYSVAKGTVLTVNVANGILTNDFDDEDSGAVLNAILAQGAKYTGANAPPLPITSLAVFPNGSFQFVAPSDYDGSYGDVQFIYTARNIFTGDADTTDVTIRITSGNTGGGGGGGSVKYFATGSGVGSPSSVRVFDSSSGNEIYSFTPYEPAFTGGVRVVTGDLNRDGVDDIAVAPSNGGGGRIKVYDGRFGTELVDFNPFEDTFRGGADVAIGNIDGLGGNDLIIGAGEGGGPRVTVYNGAFIQNLNSPDPVLPAVGTTAPILNFFAYESSFRNGVRVAAGDLDNTRSDANFPRDYIVTGPGIGGGPAVKIYDGVQVKNALSIGIAQPAPLRSFFAFDPASRGGVNIAIGQFRGDSRGDIIAGAGTGSPIVRIFDGRTSAQIRELTYSSAESPSGGNFGSGGTSNLFGSPTSGSSNNLLLSGGIGATASQGGVRIGAADRNGDGRSDIVAGPGQGSASRVRFYDGNSLSEINSFLAYPTTFLGGVFIGGNSLP
ncbi:MAG: hypothetical protein ACRCZF_15435 [Gemmataceae bacterium]